MDWLGALLAMARKLDDIRIVGTPAQSAPYSGVPSDR
jgi:hypothetical protein